MARQEIGQVQEMLTVPAASQELQERAEEEEGPDDKEQTVTRSLSDQPLEGANARLEELKESLYQKEREITELLEAERSPIPPVPQPRCSVLLPTVITKAHEICSAVAEARALLDQMIEDNQAALADARDNLRLYLQSSKDDSDDKEKSPSHESSDESRLSFLQATVREQEVCQIALDCIKSGESPVINGEFKCKVT
ncbi:uncharacterized protein V3H82_008440 [Fundulus diaphanus]